MVIKVCHFSTGHDGNDARIFQKQCTSLADAGYDVTLIVPFGDSDTRNGVEIISLDCEVGGRLKRMVNISKEVFKRAVSVNADIYHFHDPELIPFGLKLKKMGKIVIFDSHEDTPADILNKDWIPRYLRLIVSKVYNFYESRAVKKFDSVISVTPHIVDRFKKLNAQSFLITNYPILEQVNDLAISDIDKDQNALVFVGRVCAESMQHKIIEAISDIDDIRYIFAGPADDSYLESLKTLPGWHKCDYKGIISFSEANNLVIKGAAGVQITDYIPNFGYDKGSLGNTKMFTYMAAGIPLICTDMMLWKEIVEENKCGICVNPRNVEEIRNAINFIIENRDIGIEMGVNGRQAVKQKYNWSTQVQLLLEIYESLGQKIQDA